MCLPARQGFPSISWPLDDLIGIWERIFQHDKVFLYPWIPKIYRDAEPKIIFNSIGKFLFLWRWTSRHFVSRQLSEKNEHYVCFFTLKLSISLTVSNATLWKEHAFFFFRVLNEHSFTCSYADATKLSVLWKTYPHSSKLTFWSKALLNFATTVGNCSFCFSK